MLVTYEIMDLNRTQIHDTDEQSKIEEANFFRVTLSYLSLDVPKSGTNIIGRGLCVLRIT